MQCKVQVHLDICIPAEGEPYEEEAFGVGRSGAVKVHAAFSQPVKAAPRNQCDLRMSERPAWKDAMKQRSAFPSHEKPQLETPVASWKGMRVVIRRASLAAANKPPRKWVSVAASAREASSTAWRAVVQQCKANLRKRSNVRTDSV